MTTSKYDASSYSNGTLGVTSSSGSQIYVRKASNVLSETKDDAVDLGTLTTDSTQLDVKSQVSQINNSHYYKYTLDGKNMKLSFTNNTATSDLRVQIMNSSGKVIADSSTTADSDLQTAYKKLASNTGLSEKAGDYYVHVSFDATAKKSVSQQYSIGLYSGTKFTTAYQTTAAIQTKTSTKVMTDNTMTYSLIDALSYSSKETHRANEDASSAINAGWLSADKSALDITGQMTWVCSNQYYSFTLQKGDDIKMAFNNKTDTAKLRVQLYDSTGTKLMADSGGSDKKLITAYNNMISSKGLTAEKGSYMVKVSYDASAGNSNQKAQTYDMKLYSGQTYDTLYETQTSTETASTALFQGDLTSSTNPKAAAATYLATQLSEDSDYVYTALNTNMNKFNGV